MRGEGGRRPDEGRRMGDSTIAYLDCLRPRRPSQLPSPRRGIGVYASGRLRGGTSGRENALIRPAGPFSRAGEGGCFGGLGGRVCKAPSQSPSPRMRGEGGRRPDEGRRMGDDSRRIGTQVPGARSGTRRSLFFARGSRRSASAAFYSEMTRSRDSWASALSTCVGSAAFQIS